MKPNRLTYADPFTTLVQLTASALSGTRQVADQAPEVTASDAGQSLFDRLDGWLWRARQRELDRSLADATDVADLEHRLADRVGLFGRYS